MLLETLQLSSDSFGVLRHRVIGLLLFRHGQCAALKIDEPLVVRRLSSYIRRVLYIYTRFYAQLLADPSCRQVCYIILKQVLPICGWLQVAVLQYICSKIHLGGEPMQNARRKG
jgi:hypothetical protein